jgi:hypothetical protein
VEIRIRFINNTAKSYKKFHEEFAKLAGLMPDIARKVVAKEVDRQYILKKMK